MISSLHRSPQENPLIYSGLISINEQQFLCYELQRGTNDFRRRIANKRAATKLSMTSHSARQNYSHLRVPLSNTRYGSFILNSFRCSI